MSDIFISYSNSDLAKARELAHALEQKGWSVWWDRSIPPGKTSSEVLEKALAAAGCILVLWSRASANTDWVLSEAAEGMRRKILIPALIEETELPLEFKMISAANLVGWPEQTSVREYDRFLQAIQEVLNLPASAPSQKLAADQPLPASKEKQTPKQPLEWPKGLGTRMAFMSLLSGTVLAGAFKATFPQTPISEALTTIALLALLCGAGLSLGWTYFKRKE